MNSLSVPTRVWRTVAILSMVFSYIITISFSTDAIASNKLKPTKHNVEVNDPFESVNRGIHSFNSVVDDYFLAPVARGYRWTVPPKGRKAVRNVLRNIGEPVNFLNALLQGDIHHAATTLWRFTINSTLGGAGIMDVAGKGQAKLEYRSEDFGQTLGHYGVGDGFYLVLPLMGSSSGRDFIGRGVDGVSNPVNYWLNDYGSAARVTTSIISGREATLDLTEQVENVSLDPYATYRSLYIQRRWDQIYNGEGEQ